MPKLHRFDGVPSPRLMQTIGATALDPTESVAELVANCFDARIGDEPISIDIRFADDDSYLTVSDTASGMTLKTLSDAARLGVDMDLVTTKPARQRMGTYGLGMKTAAASLGEIWGIHTRPVEEPGKEYRVTFDLSKYISRGATSNDWAFEVEESPVDVSGFLGDRPHGTVVWVKQLRKPLKPGPLVAFIGRAFGSLASVKGDTMRVNNHYASEESYSIVPDSRREIHIEVDASREWFVHGWVALDMKTHNNDEFGIDLFRNNQLIEKWDKSFFRAHTMTSRVIGSLHLDFVPVNFNKKGFVKTSEEWQYVSKRMTEELRPVAKASQIMNRGRGDVTREKRAVMQMNKVLGDGSTDSQSAPNDSVHEPQPQKQSDEASPIDTVKSPFVTANSIELPHMSIRLASDVEALQDETLPWDYVFDVNNRKELVVFLNSESSVYRAAKDVEFLTVIAIGDAIARFLTEREGLEPKSARKLRDQWIHRALTRDS